MQGRGMNTYNSIKRRVNVSTRDLLSNRLWHDIFPDLGKNSFHVDTCQIPGLCTTTYIVNNTWNKLLRIEVFVKRREESINVLDCVPWGRRPGCPNRVHDSFGNFDDIVRVVLLYLNISLIKKHVSSLASNAVQSILYLSCRPVSFPNLNRFNFFIGADIATELGARILRHVGSRRDSSRRSCSVRRWMIRGNEARRVSRLCFLRSGRGGDGRR